MKIAVRVKSPSGFLSERTARGGKSNAGGRLLAGQLKASSRLMAGGESLPNDRSVESLFSRLFAR